MRPALARTSRLYEFARHMPMRKLARRVELDVRRRIGDYFGRRPAGPQSELKRSGAPPAPVFAPRPSAMTAEADRLIFTFLNRTVAMTAGRIEWNAPSPAPTDQLWRMNLHYMEYLEDTDDAVWARITTEWLDANGVPSPGAWRDGWNSYTVSIRVVVWLQELVRRSGRIEAGLTARLEASAVEQIRFLLRNLETDLGGNHLVKNIKALIWASCYFAGAEAQGWRQRGIALLRAALAEQILPDGGHYERSPSYCAQVFSDLLECRHALGHDPLQGRLDSALAAMAQVVADLAHPDGGPVLFNDAGLSMAYAPAECLDAYSLVIGAAVLPRATFAFRDTGYFGLRGPTSYLVADCGRIAPDDLPAHGHGDVLSFELSVAGERIIVDQGVFEYVAGAKRQASRSAASHNTLSLDGADQADFFGAFRCGRRPNVEVRRYEVQADGFVLEGSHDGFAHLPGRPVHVRRFEASPGQIEIIDRIEGSTDRSASIGFLLHPEVRVAVDGQRAVLSRGAARIELRASVAIACEPAVWWPDMGHELATRRLVVSVLPQVGRIATALAISETARMPT